MPFREDETKFLPMEYFLLRVWGRIEDAEPPTPQPSCVRMALLPASKEALLSVGLLTSVRHTLPISGQIHSV